jgi:ubiquinone/menaquinone biosynthesis C-methylase UbiE
VEHALLEPSERLLDVGCGTGGLTIPARKRLGEKGGEAGIDPAPEMIAVARRRAGRAGLEIDFHSGVIESLPYPVDSFDVVTSSLMMHHLPEHVHVQGLAEIHRVLKPGGRLLVADMKRPGDSFISRLISRIMHHGHTFQFGIENLPKLLMHAGFEAIELLDDRVMMIGFVQARKGAV